MTFLDTAINKLESISKEEPLFDYYTNIHDEQRFASILLFTVGYKEHIELSLYYNASIDGDTISFGKHTTDCPVLEINCDYPDDSDIKDISISGERIFYGTDESAGILFFELKCNDKINRFFNIVCENGSILPIYHTGWWGIEDTRNHFTYSVTEQGIIKWEVPDGAVLDILEGNCNDSICSPVEKGDEIYDYQIRLYRVFKGTLILVTGANSIVLVLPPSPSGDGWNTLSLRSKFTLDMKDVIQIEVQDNGGDNGRTKHSLSLLHSVWHRNGSIHIENTTGWVLSDLLGTIIPNKYNTDWVSSLE